MANWIIDEVLQERQYETGFPSLADAARQLGHNVFVTKHKPFSEHPFPEGIPFSQSECVITYGCIQFCKLVEKHYGRWWTPGLYFNKNVKNFSKWAPHIAHRDLLSDDYYILPYGEFERRQYNCAGFSCFVKPESGLKEFVGQVIHAAEFQDDLKKLQPFHAIDSDTLCVIASPKEIKAEFRYVIVNKEVITGSEYRWDDKLDVRLDTHPMCDALAKKVAYSDWQADSVYICDIALMPDDSAKVIELNAFSSSGLYACDTLKIVGAVSKAAEEEHG